MHLQLFYIFIFPLFIFASLTDKVVGIFIPTLFLGESKSQKVEGTHLILFDDRRNAFNLNICKYMLQGKTSMQTKKMSNLNFSPSKNSIMS